MSLIATTVSKNIASSPRSEPIAPDQKAAPYYRFAWAVVTANGLTKNRLTLRPILSAGPTTSPDNIFAATTWLEITTELSVLGIDSSKLTDPAN